MCVCELFKIVLLRKKWDDDVPDNNGKKSADERDVYRNCFFVISYI